MWINASTEKNWANLFGYQDKPLVVVLNPGARKRYVIHEGTISISDLK